MIDHYNAFISYKHAPLDSKIAQRVQRKLEHFTVPGKIAKRTGKKKIERVFRDKDELPITSDLSDTISHALKNSDYLIVICSPESKKSVWVQREISFFLESHPLSKVLTVLADGEPYDVIPEILLNTEKTVTDEDGIERTVKVAMEPLSCDYRIPIKKADKTEFPRLAAALLGCSYDELMDRNRQYRMRRMGLVFGLIISILLAFGEYLINSRRQIKESYIDSLKSRSLYLANESSKLYEEQRRMDAIRLAIEALPENEDYHVTPEAVRALTDSTLAYRSCAGNSIEAVWNYNMPNNVVDFIVTDNREVFTATDESNNIIMWDTDTHEELMRLMYDEPVYGMEYLNDDRLIVWGNNSITAYDTTDGGVVWSNSDLERTLRKDNIYFTLNNDIYLMTGYPSGLVVIDGQDGRVKSFHQFETGGIASTVYVSKLCISPDGLKAGVITYDIGSSHALDIYSLSDDSRITYGEFDMSVDAFQWIDSSRIVLALNDDDTVYHNGDGDVTDLSTTEIICIDTNDMTECWRNIFTCANVSYKSGFMNLPSRDGIMYYNADKATAYNIQTGEIINDYHLNNSVIDVSDGDDDGLPLFVTNNGDLLSPAYYDEGRNTLIVYHEFIDNISDCTVGGGVYVLEDMSSEILYYNVYVYDEEWEEVGHNLTMDYYPSEAFVGDDFIAIPNYVRNAGFTVYLIDPDDHDYVRSFTPMTFEGAESGGLNVRILGTHDGRLYTGICHTGSTDVFSIDVENGQTDTFVLGSYSPALASDTYAMYGQYIMAVDSDTRTSSIRIYDIEEEEIISCDLPWSDPEITKSMEYLPAQNRIWISESSQDLIVDVEYNDYEEIDLPRDWAGTIKTAVNSDETIFAATDGIRIIIMDEEFDEVSEITCNSSTPIGMNFCEIGGETVLTVVYGNGYLLRYDAASGELLGRTSVTDVSDQATIDYDGTSGYIYIQSYFTTDIIDPANWYEVASIPNCLGHHVPTDTFYTLYYQSSAEYNVGYYEHYSLEDLISKAQDILQGTELSDELRAEYGI